MAEDRPVPAILLVLSDVLDPKNSLEPTSTRGIITNASPMLWQDAKAAIEIPHILRDGRYQVPTNRRAQTLVENEQVPVEERIFDKSEFDAWMAPVAQVDEAQGANSSEPLRDSDLLLNVAGPASLFLPALPSEEDLGKCYREERVPLISNALRYRRISRASLISQSLLSAVKVHPFMAPSG
ncbi:uncharacterized protein PAC_03394 [Phialocephala subalpina]|uniref:Uncharacterized protein n=1 Tax=Phialocephala subalpina TaxID=576137 RepID=A0A1L7WL74_9HELO|nr:uncharacterized protein PAC_03394 [Phialocephala subalpina]